jgi:teichuronic acid biosynthesis glycosyltransferase TuaG
MHKMQVLPDQPLVSIVMPCYRSADTLEKAVQGIVHQSYPHWELLLMLDGNEAEDLAIAQQLEASDDRIRCLRSAKNRGVIRARNLGIRLARGQWLAFCDADDFWLPHKLEWQIHAAGETGAKLVCSAFWYLYERGEALTFSKVRLPKQLNWSMMLRTNAIPMSTAMFHLNALGRHFFEPMPPGYIHEDYDFWLSLMAKPEVEALSLPQATTVIRVRPGSRSSNKWQALNSHAYILRKRAGIRGSKLLYSMLNYLFWGLFKRLSTQSTQRKSWPEQ